MTRTDSEFNEDWAYLEILDRVMRDEDAGRTLGMDDYLALFPAHDETVREVWRRVMSPEPATEEVIGDRYRIVRELGRGGQAIVYLAEDSKLGRQVALKVMRWVSTSGVNRQLIRLEREALAASRLDHPGICTVFDSGAQDGTCYIAMRLVEGEPLAKIIARARHETDITKSGSPIRDTDTLHRMATIVAKTASALSTAHESGIIHRDIKPGNLMITPSGDPVILDFGLARDEQSTLSTLTVTGDPMGRPHTWRRNSGVAKVSAPPQSSGPSASSSSKPRPSRDRSMDRVARPSPVAFDPPRTQTPAP